MKREKVIEYLEKTYSGEKSRWIGSGWSSDAFEVGDKIIRIPKAKTKPYIKEAALLECLLGRLSVQIPQPHVIKEPFFYVEHKKIEGHSWNIDTYNRLSSAQQELFARDIAHFFAEVHAIPCSVVQKAIPKNGAIDRLFTLKQFQAYLGPYFSADDIALLYHWTSDTLKPRGELVLLHRDFQKGNSVVDENHRLVGVFDWANAAIDEPAWDFMSLRYSSYAQLLNLVLRFYQEETGRVIDPQRISDLAGADMLPRVQYLARFLKQGEEPPKEWMKTIRNIRKLLKKIKKREGIGTKIKFFIIKLKKVLSYLRLPPKEAMAKQ